MRPETARQMSCLLKRQWDSRTSLKEHPFLSAIILTGRVLCKVIPAMPTWGLPQIAGPRGGALVAGALCFVLGVSIFVLH